MHELTIPDRAGFRPVGLRTRVRPDYYEWFPVFGDIELISRLHSLPFVEATLAVPRNVERAIELFPSSADMRHDLTTLIRDHQGDGWLSILRRLGFRKAVIDAFARVPRAEFIPGKYRKLAWMNHYIWYDEGSCLSSLGVVALMADAVADKQVESLVEVGYGGGYQLALFSALLSNPRLIGYEANVAVAEQGRQNLARLRVGEQFELHAGVFAVDKWPAAPNTLVYATCGIPSNVYADWERCLQPSQILLAPRMLDEIEFNSLSADDGFRNLFGNYHDYQLAGSFLVISLSETKNGSLVRQNIVYDVQMVPFEADIRAGNLENVKRNEEWLRRLSLC